MNQNFPSDAERGRVSFTLPCDFFDRRVVDVLTEVNVASPEKRPKGLDFHEGLSLSSDLCHDLVQASRRQTLAALS